jgi:hypothetical protein
VGATALLAFNGPCGAGGDCDVPVCRGLAALSLGGVFVLLSPWAQACWPPLSPSVPGARQEAQTDGPDDAEDQAGWRRELDDVIPRQRSAIVTQRNEGAGMAERTMRLPIYNVCSSAVTPAAFCANQRGHTDTAARLRPGTKFFSQLLRDK